MRSYSNMMLEVSGGLCLWFWEVNGVFKAQCLWETLVWQTQRLWQPLTQKKSNVALASEEEKRHKCLLMDWETVSVLVKRPDDLLHLHSGARCTTHTVSHNAVRTASISSVMNEAEVRRLQHSCLRLNALCIKNTLNPDQITRNQKHSWYHVCLFVTFSTFTWTTIFWF